MSETMIYFLIAMFFAIGFTVLGSKMLGVIAILSYVVIPIIFFFDLAIKSPLIALLIILVYLAIGVVVFKIACKK